MKAINKHSLEIFGSLETKQLGILGFLRWMHAVVREHVELRARLDPWKLAASYAPMTPTNYYNIYMKLGGVGGKLSGLNSLNDV